jgi:ankyrin repeat protein
MVKPREVVGAAQRADLAELKRLKGDLNASYRNYRPLHALIQEEKSATAKRLACLDWLLSNGADPELTGGWPPARAIVTAAFMGIPEYVEPLRKAGAKIDGFVAAALGDVAGVQKALQADPAFANARDTGVLTALQCAAGSRMPDADTVGVARLLLDAGADPRALTHAWHDDVEATYFAVGSKQTELLQLLLDRGADPNEALSHAAWSNCWDLVERAMRAGGHPDRATANGKPLLNDLIRWGRLEGTLWLLAHGASANVPDTDGWTAVHQAASRGNVRMLQAAIAAGGDPVRKDKLGHTPSDVATIMKKPKIVDALRAR